MLQEAGNADDKAKEEEEEAQESVTAFNGEMRQSLASADVWNDARHQATCRDCWHLHCLQIRLAWLCRHLRWCLPRSGGTSLFLPLLHWQRHRRQLVSAIVILQCAAVHFVHL